MGTGIYRQIKRHRGVTYGVPCGYRDIPQQTNVLMKIQKRSLWVQGYTESVNFMQGVETAFPVGTGIYRDLKRPTITLLVRSLWVQGYTAIYSKFYEQFKAFPVGTGIYRPLV